MKFDLNKILSMFNGKKKRKTSAEDFENKNEFLDEETEKEFEEDIFDEEDKETEDQETEKNIEKDKKKTINNTEKKFSINLKNKKVQLSIAVIAVLTLIGAISAPYIMSYIGEEQADNIGNVSNFTQPTYMSKPKRRPLSYRRNNTQHIQHIHIHKTAKSNGLIKKTNLKNQNQINITRNNNKNKTVLLNKNNRVLTRINKVAQIQQAIKGTNSKIDKIQKHLINAKLQGVNDPIGLIDKTVMTNRNFNLYLQSQIQLMRKLVSYYKQKAELQKTLQLYKMAFYKNRNKQNNNRQNGNSQQKMEQIQKVLQKVVSPLQQQIIVLKQELEKAKQQNLNKNKINNQRQTSADFNQMTKLKLNDLNIFIKNGKYIAVVHTDIGDKIFKEGDFFNGYRIDKILPNMIIFEKNGQKFYYTYNQTLNQKYQVAKIELPGKLSKSEVRTEKTKTGEVKEYKTVSRQKLLQQLLQKRLKQIR